MRDCARPAHLRDSLIHFRIGFLKKEKKWSFETRPRRPDDDVSKSSMEVRSARSQNTDQRPYRITGTETSRETQCRARLDVARESRRKTTKKGPSVPTSHVSQALGATLGGMQLGVGIVMIVASPILRHCFLAIVRHLYPTSVGMVHIWCTWASDESFDASLN